MQRFSTDPIHDNAKQEALDFIRSQIITMVEHGEEGIFVNETVNDIDLSDIHSYMKFLQTDKSLPFKLPLVRFTTVNDIEKFGMLCDYVDIHNVQVPSKGTQKVYFIETADFAITFIPIQLDSNEVNVYIEPLECSPDFVLEMWDKLTTKPSIEDINWVKFDKTE